MITKFACDMALAHMPTSYERFCGSPFYNVTLDKSNGYVYMDPKSGEHDKTIVFMHGHGGTAQ